MFKAKRMTDGDRTDYSGQIAILHDDDLAAEAARQILEAGYSPRHCDADTKAGLCWLEAENRGKPHLYQRGYNRAANDAGVTLDPIDIRRAQAA